MSGADKSQALLDPVNPAHGGGIGGGGGGGDPGTAVDNADEAVLRPSCTRWWVMFLYCFLAMCQAATWNIFSPISPTVALAFPTWSTAYVNWVINTANIAFGCWLFVTPVLINKLGPRFVTIFSAGSVLLGAAVRMLPLDDAVPMQVVMVLSMVFNGIGGAWSNFGGPLVSELWFPATERTMATAITSSATYVGSALGFVVGPAIVGTPTNQTTARAAMNNLFYIEAGCCLACFIACIAHFPSRPVHPPSEAAAAKRQHNDDADDDAAASGSAPSVDASGLCAYFQCGCCSSDSASASGDACDDDPEGAHHGDGALARLTSPRFVPAQRSLVFKYWVVSIAMAIPLGMYQGWTSVLYNCLGSVNVTENQAAWLGFSMTMSGCLGSVLVGVILDRFLGYLKLVTEVLMVVSMTAFALFSLNASAIIDMGDHDASVAFTFATGIVGGIGVNVAVPLFFELIMETIFGWGNEGAGAMLTVAINTVVQISFLVILASEDPTASTLWTAWAAAGSAGAAFLLLLFFRVEYRRLSVDRGTPLKDTGCRFDRAVGCY